MKKHLIGIALFLMGLSNVAVAHHGWGGQYDTTKEIELTGVVKSVQWTNPHVTFKLLVDGGKATEKLWTIESNSVSALSRMGVEKSTVPVGGTVKVSGFGPVMGANFGLFMNHMLLPNNKEIVFLRGAAPRWSDEIIGNDDALHGKIVENDINKRPSTIFSVWTVVYNDKNSHGLHMISGGTANTSPGGMAPAPAANNDGAIVVCAPKTMLQIMGTPYPVQLIDDSKNKKVIFKAEENDSVRTIFLTAEHKTEGIPSLMGYSTGILDTNKKKLTVTTSNVQGSPTTVYTETFELSEDRNRVNYTVKTNNNNNAVQGRYWQYQPGASVMAYGCTNTK